MIVKRNILKMKKSIQFKLVLLSFALIILNDANANDYTWVGGTSAWTTPGNWSASPGSPANSIPTATDNVIINIVISPKVYPTLASTTTIANLVINGGRLTISGSSMLIIGGTVNITGVSARILGNGAQINIGSAGTPSAQVNIGDGNGGTMIDPAVTAYCNAAVLTKTNFRGVNLQGDNFSISDCNFVLALSVTKVGTQQAMFNGTITCSSTAAFTNQGTGAFLFGNTAAADVFNFKASTFTNTGEGAMLFGNTDNDVFSFGGLATFTKSSTGQIEVARFGNTEFLNSLTYNAPAGEISTFGNVGGGLCSFKGGVAQIIKGTGSAFNFNKIAVDKTAGTVTLQIPINLISMPGATLPDPQLNLLNGNLVTTNNTTPAKLITVSDGTVVTLNADPNKSFVSGPMRKNGMAAFTFPLGKGTTFRPLSISASIPSDVCTFTAEYFNAAPPSGTSLNADIPTLSSCEYWKLTKDAGTSNVITTLTWPAIGCEAIQPIGLKFCRFNSTTSKWETVLATQYDATSTLVSNAELTTYGNLALGYSSKRIYLDTRGLDPVNFTITGAQLPEGTVYISGKSGPNKDGNIPLLPVLPSSGTSLITVDMAPGAENEAMKITFEIDNTSAISNVNAITDNTSTYRPLSAEFFSIDNTPTNAKAIKFLRGDELTTPVVGTNLTDGTVMMNSAGTNLQITGLTGSTVTSFKIFAKDNSLIKGPLTVGVWDGTDVNSQEVPSGVYKYELTISNNSKSYTYNGQVIVK
jgi:hypothetical protein